MKNKSVKDSTFAKVMAGILVGLLVLGALAIPVSFIFA